MGKMIACKSQSYVLVPVVGVVVVDGMVCSTLSLCVVNSLGLVALSTVCG